MVATERNRIVRFEKGLRHGLRSIVGSYRSVTFGESFQAALKVELEQDERNADMGRKDKKRPASEAETSEAGKDKKKQKKELVPGVGKGKGKAQDKGKGKQKAGYDIFTVSVFFALSDPMLVSLSNNLCVLVRRRRIRRKGPAICVARKAIS